MPILLDPPVILPPAPQAEFKELYITRLVIEISGLPSAANPNTGHVMMELLPYNPDLQLLGPESEKIVLSSGQLFSLIQQSPTGPVALAFAAIVNAVPEWKAFIDAQNALVV